MNTLHERLADLADGAPTGGAPPAELWARGKRAQRLRTAALAATLLVVGAAGTGIGVRLADGDGNRSGPAPAGTVGFALPIEYPVGEELPDLGDTPGRLAAVWLVPRADGVAPDAVGLVAETGTFGTLPIELPRDPQSADSHDVSLSPDGRRIAYASPTHRGIRGSAGQIVRDLVTGESFPSDFGFQTRGVGFWVDATHLFGYVAGGSDADGWLWEPGKAPTSANPYLVPYNSSDISVASVNGYSRPRSCPSVGILDVAVPTDDGWEPVRGYDLPELCSALGIIGSEILLGHWRDADDGNGTVVALDLHDAVRKCPEAHICELSIDHTQRRVVVTAGAPQLVTLATDLIGEALEADGGAS